MYILKNALLSIRRNKGRNILIGIIIIVISGACAITLSILNSANKIVSSYEEKYNVEATIGMNRDNLVNSFKEDDSTQEEMIDKFNDIESITVDDINNYGTSEYVKEYYYTYNISMDALDIEEATDSLVKETTTTKTEEYSTGGSGQPGMPGGDGGGKKTTTTKTEEIKNMKAENGAFTVIGYSSVESMTEFIEGTYTITDGSISTDFTGSNCIISEELATLNDLSVGDTITLVNPDHTKKTYELTITGIYKENTDSSSDMANMFSSTANTIITNATVVENIISDDEDMNVTLSPTFVLTSTDVVDAFKEEVSSKGLSEYYTVNDNLDTVESATKSIKNVKNFAITFLIITLIIGGVVLVVINMINIRERKYEIGVLRTIGMSKLSVSFEFIFELLIIAIISLFIGAGIGSCFSVKVSNSLLQNEIENTSTDYDDMSKNFGEGFDKQFDISKVNGISSIDSIDSIDAVVDFKVLLELLGIGIVLTLISSSSSIIAINRFSPLSILKERS